MVYAEGRSLVVVGSVGTNAQVLSDESIHILGKLSGKAMCGLRGSLSSSIFCLHFNASFVGVGDASTDCSSNPDLLKLQRAVRVSKNSSDENTLDFHVF